MKPTADSTTRDQMFLQDAEDGHDSNNHTGTMGIEQGKGNLAEEVQIDVDTDSNRTLQDNTIKHTIEYNTTNNNPISEMNHQIDQVKEGLECLKMKGEENKAFTASDENTISYGSDTQHKNPNEDHRYNKVNNVPDKNLNPNDVVKEFPVITTGARQPTNDNVISADNQPTIENIRLPNEDDTKETNDHLEKVEGVVTKVTSSNDDNEEAAAKERSSEDDTSSKSDEKKDNTTHLKLRGKYLKMPKFLKKFTIKKNQTTPQPNSKLESDCKKSSPKSKFRSSFRGYFKKTKMKNEKDE